MESIQIKTAVKEQYGKVAKGEATCGSLCGCTDNAEGLAITFGYSPAELATLPEGANLGLSCGNPQAVAAMKPGETVLDLGSGAGFDCFLAARKVGPAGRVIGVNMTDEMLAKARGNAEKSGLDNVEFRKGEIEGMETPTKLSEIQGVQKNSKDRLDGRLKVLKKMGELGHVFLG